MNQLIRNEKKDRSSHYLLENFFHQFVNNFLVLLLCKINVLDIFNMVDVFFLF